MFLQQIDSPLVCVGRIIVAAHTFLKGQREINGTHHVGVVLLALVVKDKATLPQGCDALDTLELVGLLSLVWNNGQLVAS